MGHIVNPIVFRVGVRGSNVKWVSTWFSNLQNKKNVLKYIFSDYLIITYIYVFFRSLKKKTRSVLFTTFSKKIQKKFGTRKFKKRVYYFHYVVRRHSFVISHIKVVRNVSILKIGIFFFDSSFVTNFNQFLSDYVLFSFFNYQKYKQDQRDRLSLLEGDKRRFERRRFKRRRKHLTYLLRYRNHYKIGRLYPSYYKERNLKKKISVNFRASLSWIMRSQFLFKRINKNMRQFSYNNKAFYSIYKNLLWYILTFRSFKSYNKKSQVFSLQRFLGLFYHSKFKASFFSKIFDSCFLRKFSYKSGFKNKMRVKYFIYNLYIKKIRVNLFALLIKRIKIIVFLVKKYTFILEQNFNIMMINLPTSVLYINSLNIYNFCLKLLHFVYLELNQLKDFYYNNAYLFNYLKQYLHRRFVKIKKWTRLLLQIRSKKKYPFIFKRDNHEILLQFYNNLFQGSYKSVSLFNRFSVKNIIKWNKPDHYLSTLLSSKRFLGIRQNLLKSFKVLFLVLVQRLDLFWSKFVRRFYFKLFLYCCFFLLLFIMDYRRNFFRNFITWFNTAYFFVDIKDRNNPFYSLFLVKLRNKFSFSNLKSFSFIFDGVKELNKQLKLKIDRITKMKRYRKFKKSVIKDYLEKKDFVFENSFVFLFLLKVFNLTNILGSVLLKLLMILQKNYYLCRRRFIRYNFVYQARFHLFLIYSNIFKTSSIFKNDHKVSFGYYGLDQKSLTSGVVLRYICKLLRNRYPFKFILRNVVRDLQNYVRYIGGFRIVCAGRLTKKQRAAFVIKSGGAVNLSSLQVNVDFATDFVITKHGAVGLKLWLSRTKHFAPFFYKIDYIYDGLFHTT